MIAGSPPNSCGDDKRGCGSEIPPFLGEFVFVVVIEEIMQFGHEQLEVYRVSPEYAIRESLVPFGDYDNENEHENE
ncbi:MAG: hypothetical protein JRJ60_21180 [Deltaproteobacteria bacterium]|nr:hypothetical protein [Deltaproteobacteria bacterium]